MYMGDNNGFFLPVGVGFSSITWAGSTRTGVSLPWWSGAVAGSYVENTTAGATAWPTSQQRANAKVVYCPAGLRNFHGTGNSTWIGINNCDWPYPNFTSGISSSGSTSKAYHRASRAQNADRLLTFCDTVGGAWQQTDLTKPGAWRPWHGLQANIAFMDGHVSTTFDLTSSKNSGEVAVQMKE